MRKSCRSRDRVRSKPYPGHLNWQADQVPSPASPSWRQPCAIRSPATMPPAGGQRLRPSRFCWQRPGSGSMRSPCRCWPTAAAGVSSAACSPRRPAPDGCS
jgi:hypothetical protein